MMNRIAREVETSRFFQSARLEDLPRMTGTTGIVARSADYAASEKGTWTADPR